MPSQIYIKADLYVGIVLQILTYMTMCLCKRLPQIAGVVGKCGSKHCVIARS